MSARLGFAIAANVEPDILLVDEVLAVGDADFQAKCLSRMQQFKEQGRTVVLVTHSLDQAQSFCDRAVVLDHGTMIFDGPAASADEAYGRSSRAEHVVVPLAQDDGPQSTLAPVPPGHSQPDPTPPTSSAAPVPPPIHDSPLAVVHAGDREPS